MLWVLSAQRRPRKAVDSNLNSRVKYIFSRSVRFPDIKAKAKINRLFTHKFCEFKCQMFISAHNGEVVRADVYCRHATYM